MTCPHEYFDMKDCRRCTPPPNGECIYCGTIGEHYCPHDVARGNKEDDVDNP